MKRTVKNYEQWEIHACGASNDWGVIRSGTVDLDDNNEPEMTSMDCIRVAMDTLQEEPHFDKMKLKAIIYTNRRIIIDESRWSKEIALS